MKIAHVVPDLLTSLSTATSVQSGLDLALRRLLRLSGADAGALEFDPPRGEPIVVVAGGPRGCPTSSRQSCSAPCRPGATPRATRARGRCLGPRRAIRRPARWFAASPSVRRAGRWAGSC